MIASKELTSISAAVNQRSCSRMALTSAHFEVKPAVSGTPIRLRPPSSSAAVVHGMLRPTPRTALMRVEPTR